MSIVTRKITSDDSAATDKRGISRIVWLDVAYVVEERHEAEYAVIVRLRKRPATRDEVEGWKFGPTTTKEA